MTKITFYHQARQDGDVRSGVSINDDIVFDRYSGRNKNDPALRWFVDVRCEGDLPSDPEEAREWLLSNATSIKAGLEEFSDKLTAGLDVESWPVSFKVKHPARKIRIAIVCSATRLLDARDIALNLSLVAAHFEEFVSKLQAVEPIGR
jgi:hypothetical protein